MQYIIPDNVYKILKWVGLVLCPALAVLISKVGAAWGLPSTEPIMTTVNEVGLFIGACIGVSQITAKETNG